MVRIDAHAHVFARASSEFPRESIPAYPAEREEPVEKLLGEMEANNIDQAVLVQLGGTRIEHHAYLRHCLETYPDRFLGIGLIPPDCREPEEHMDRLAADGNIVGFRLRTLGGPHSRRYGSSSTTWECAREKGSAGGTKRGARWSIAPISTIYHTISTGCRATKT